MSVRDVRFHTSQDSSGSDAMSPDPEYSCVYVELHTNAGIDGVALAFSIGRGNETIAAAVKTLEGHIVGLTLDEVKSNFGQVWRRITADGQMKWIGPEKGAYHQAAAAVINALWDLWGKTEGKPVWQLIADLSPEQLLSTMDLRYVEDVLPAEEVLRLLHEAADSKQQCAEEMKTVGYPAYTTSTGWLGYSDEVVKAKTEAALAEGYTAFKIKVGTSLADDCKRAAMTRGLIGWRNTLMMDANCVWGVDETIAAMQELKKYNPYWIEEPTCPDDILGHAKIQAAVHPVHVATGEQCANRVLFKQFLQVKGLEILQTDIVRLAGINEYLVVCLLAKKFNTPICIHAGGVGLCNMAAHLAAIDFVVVSRSMEGRMAEYIDHLQEHFVDELVVRNARYIAPSAPGLGLTMHKASLDKFAYPDGPYWSARPGHFTPSK